MQVTVGDQSIVFPTDYCGLKEFPDQTISLLSNYPFRFLMVVGKSTMLMQGNQPEAAEPVNTVLAPRGGEYFDNSYAGITSVYHDQTTGKLLGFYHAEDQAGMQPTSYNPEIPGAYWSIGLAVSDDNGDTFKDGQQILRSSIDKAKVSWDHQGIGDVYVIPDATGQYLYAYYTDLTRRSSDPVARIGMARSSISDGAQPGTWYKYYNGNFDQAGLGGDESGIVTPPNTFSSEVIQPHVVYLPLWKRYVMVCSVVSYEDQKIKMANEGGIFLCHSKDGIVWSEPKVVFHGLPTPFREKEYVAHPTLYLKDIRLDKAEGYLLYAYTPSQGWNAPSEPHHLASRPITLNREE